MRKSIILSLVIIVLCYVNSYSMDVAQIVHPVEKSFRDIINSDTLLYQKYLETKTSASKIVKQKITEGLLRYSLVTENNFSEFYADAKTIAKKLGLAEPKYIFIKETNELGGYTIAADTNEYVMFFHSAIFDIMTRDERKVLLAHELTHARLLHSRFAVLINMLDEATVESLLEKANMTIYQIFRYFEFSADRGSYLSANLSEEIFLKTIMRFASGVSEKNAMQSVDSYMEQINMFVNLNLSTDDLEKFYSQMPEKKRDNPFPIIKAIEIKKFIKEIAGNKK